MPEKTIPVAPAILVRTAPGRRAIYETMPREIRTSDLGQCIEQLAKYADELETRAWRGDSDTVPPRSEDNLDLLQELDDAFDRADFTMPGIEGMVRQALDAIDKFGPALRKLSGALTFREQAALAALSSFARWGDDDGVIMDQALFAWRYADALLAMSTMEKGGAA